MHCCTAAIEREKREEEIRQKINSPSEKNAKINWEKKLEEREIRLEEERKKRETKIELSKSLTKSFHLLRLCREMLAKDGVTWKKSQERREEERNEILEREDRKKRAAMKKKTGADKRELNMIQTKITSELQKIPENRRILLEQKIEKENNLELKEAREALWKRWNQKKGKIPDINKPNNIKTFKNKSVEERIEHLKKNLEKYF